MAVIKNLTLDFDGNIITLTVEQAQALKDELCRLFREPTFIPYVPDTFPRPYVWYCNTTGSDLTLSWKSE